MVDYPDLENFLFLLYGPNGKVTTGGENAANYKNPQFDRLFNEMKNRPNGPERQIVIDKMLQIIRHDAPWIWGFHPKTFTLTHQWIGASIQNEMANNILKYRRLDPTLRTKSQRTWNKPIVWPLFLVLGLIGAILIPVLLHFRKKEHAPPKRLSD